MPRIFCPLALAILAVISGCASTDVWTRKDTAYELAYIAAVAADAYTTTKLQNTPGARETQPISKMFLGSTPETADTWQYFIAVGISHYLIARSLDHEWRRYWQISGMAYHGYFAYRNCDRGYCSNIQYNEPNPPLCPNCQPIR